MSLEPPPVTTPFNGERIETTPLAKWLYLLWKYVTTSGGVPGPAGPDGATGATGPAGPPGSDATVPAHVAAITTTQISYWDSVATAFASMSAFFRSLFSSVDGADFRDRIGASDYAPEIGGGIAVDSVTTYTMDLGDNKRLDLWLYNSSGAPANFTITESGGASVTLSLPFRYSHLQIVSDSFLDVAVDSGASVTYISTGGTAPTSLTFSTTIGLGFSFTITRYELAP